MQIASTRFNPVFSRISNRPSHRMAAVFLRVVPCLPEKWYEICELKNIIRFVDYWNGIYQTETEKHVASDQFKEFYIPLIFRSLNCSGKVYGHI